MTLVACALFKCLIGLESTRARLDSIDLTIGKTSKLSELLSSPKPLAPIVWIAHLSIYVVTTTFAGLALIFDQLMRLILPALLVSSILTTTFIQRAKPLKTV
jgi:hypothetical protein